MRAQFSTRRQGLPFFIISILIHIGVNRTPYTLLAGVVYRLLFCVSLISSLGMTYCWPVGYFIGVSWRNCSGRRSEIIHKSGLLAADCHHCHLQNRNKGRRRWLMRLPMSARSVDRPSNIYLHERNLLDIFCSANLSTVLGAAIVRSKR